MAIEMNSRKGIITGILSGVTWGMDAVMLGVVMVMAPFVENPEENRSVFARLQKLSVDIRSKNIDNVSVDILSMGMTNDYQVAIEEGATMVRVGTGIFGAREYHI